MADGLYTPLQLIAASGLLANTGLAVSTTLSNSVAGYNAVPAINSLLSTVELASSYGLSDSVITQLKTLGANSCPALGDSVPADYANAITPVQTLPTIPATTEGGFAQFAEDVGNKYLGDGDFSKFTSVFAAVTGYQTQTAQIIYSTVNANKIATTFTSMDNLVTGSLTQVSLALPALGEDLVMIGNAISFANLDEYGTPAALLQQISLVAGIVRGTLPSIERALLAQGLTQDQIIRLCTPDTSTLVISRTQFNYLQQKAYIALGNIVSPDLDDILAILNVTVPGLVSLQDLLDPKKLFIKSWPSLLTTTDAGSQLIYNPNGSVNPAIQVYVKTSQFGTNNTITGCDELSKIVPPDQAVASTALSMSLSQVKNINLTDPVTLAKVLT